MKLIVLAVAALVAVALAAPAEQDPPKILRSDFEVQPDGAYAYAYETEDGIKKDENGELKTVNDEENKPHEVVVVRGSYSYTDAEGKPHSVTYYADETGFHAESEDIPKAPAQA
ncbi:larval cuticle protein 1-like isoform X1 [Cydia splendana]|uniref:larval cuticle protein 1-like isoform X1 n=1 Tax=Cydia splendana TaxID=1100963 RepID=UPI00212C00E0